jgi:hypothetical protein
MKPTKILSQENRFPCPDLKWVPPKYKSESESLSERLNGSDDGV